MCGRYSITTPIEGLRQIFLFEELPNLEARYNVAPSQEVPAVRLEDDGKRHLRMLRWGLIPFWAKDRKIGYKTINARAETVADKPAFRSAFRQRRCLIPADGFYEWHTEDGGKQPYRVVMADGSPFAFAGLWESWRDPEAGETVESCTIIVTDANATLRPIHHRMPVILPPAAYGPWLDPEAGRDALEALLQPCPDDVVAAYKVSTHVNKPANDDAACIEPLEPAEPEAPEQPSLL
jgi:putative SOS response-associated peptidase YedK